MLSACHSGSGEWSGGEGIISLARGFAYSGCPSIVYSLWEADDQSALELMKGFYKYLGRGLTKSEALQRSRLAFIGSADMLQSHPYFWAAWVVSGSDDPVRFRRSVVIVPGIAVGLIIFIGIIVLIRRRGRP